MTNGVEKALLKIAGELHEMNKKLDRLCSASILSRNLKFDKAYDLSYSDIYDFEETPDEFIAWEKDVFESDSQNSQQKQVL